MFINIYFLNLMISPEILPEAIARRKEEKEKHQVIRDDPGLKSD